MENTLRKFTRECANIKDELQDIPIIIVAPNGLEFTPKIKFIKKNEGSLDLTKENVEKVIITW